ncbi:MAG: hypothetical protein PHH43_01300 [Candidatus Cloacimonetes bacterium]|nr:hypothetical protein [Candidatus Cloacimonadota bacterium]MDD3234948.1 hypothetical protein [Candidatus Cloacimonadota bacterium]
MKTRVFVAILLLTVVAILYCSDDPSENAEYQRKTRELKALSERFKAETGFGGVIDGDINRKVLTSFDGIFKDIDMSGVRDSVAFRQACSTVITKLLPYIGAKENQLSQGYISKDYYSLGTRYTQRVNGYQIASGGYLNISYDFVRNRIFILNVTVDVPQRPVTINLSLEQAIEIVINTHRIRYHETEKALEPYEEIDIKYSNVGSSVYRLMYLITLEDVTYYVDACSGEIMGDISYVDYLSSTVNVSGKVYEPNITSMIPSVLSDSLAMHGIGVWFNNDNDYTNDNGWVTFPDLTLNSYKVKLQHQSFRISEYSDSLTTLETMEYTHAGNIYKTHIGDSCIVNGLSKLCYAPNIFTHADAQIAYMKMLKPSYDANMLIITNNVFSNPDIVGQITYTNNRIRLKTGFIPNYITHEFGHHFVWNVLNTTFAPQSQLKAMDESFAHFLSCASIPWSKLVFPNGTNSIVYDLSLPLAIDIWASTLGTINEDKYSNYIVGLNIASAWWSLRNNSIFGLSGPQTHVNAFDKLLVNVLSRRVNAADNLRYRPRYFFNSLMSEVATDSLSWTLNDQQIAIKDAYNSRGLHFYPTVESYSSGQKGRNIFGLNDPVNVKISNCPQNTRINIYVVKHGDFTYTDGAPVSALSSFYPNGFSPNTAATTDANGEWDGQIWVATEEGEYDIIVDIGSPTTPDDTIHFAFSAADVMDGFDGRTEPGFMVKDRNIDVVMALDVLAANSKALQSKR